MVLKRDLLMDLNINQLKKKKMVERLSGQIIL
jgi:hypothetical protein